MPSLKDLKNRIESVKSTRKITKAMQMVAAAKLRRAQESAEAARPYAERMTGVLSNIAVSAKDREDAPALLKGTGSAERHLLVVCTSERGLCGGFNTSIVKLAKEHISKLQGDGIIFEGVKRISYGEAEEVASSVLGSFEAGDFDVATLFYAEFQSVISQVPTALQLIPASIPDAEEDAAAATSYEYEPDEGALLDELLPKNVTTQIFRALLENAASEQGARMSAMDNATRNAGEMVDKLSIQYNRSRQAAITSELIEIISGAEAL